MVTSLWFKIAGVVLLVLAIAGGGWYVADLRADYKALEKTAEQLDADLSQQKLLASRDKAALKQAQDDLAEITAKSKAASKGVQDAYKTDPTARDWADQPIPDSLRDSIGS